MARKSVQKGKKAAKTAAPGKPTPRGRVITFRISDAEAALIQKAANRVPVARYSRDAVLARAQSDSRK